MALIAQREYWDETNPINVEVISSGGISNNTLKVLFNLIDNPIYAMVIDSDRKALFSEAKVEIIFDARLIIGGSSNGLQLFCGFRMIGWNPLVGPTDGFAVGIATLAPGIASYAILKVVAGAPTFVGYGSANPSGPTRFRLKSDDDGAEVRLQVEVDVGGGFFEVFNGQFADMSAVVGNLGDTGFLVAADTPVLESGDHALLDNIQIDEQNVVPPAPFIFPYSDGFDDNSWY